MKKDSILNTVLIVIMAILLFIGFAGLGCCFYENYYGGNNNDTNVNASSTEKDDKSYKIKSIVNQGYEIIFNDGKDVIRLYDTFGNAFAFSYKDELYYGEGSDVFDILSLFYKSFNSLDWKKGKNDEFVSKLEYKNGSENQTYEIKRLGSSLNISSAKFIKKPNSSDGKSDLFVVNSDGSVKVYSYDNSLPREIRELKGYKVRSIDYVCVEWNNKACVKTAFIAVVSNGDSKLDIKVIMNGLSW